MFGTLGNNLTKAQLLPSLDGDWKEGKMHGIGVLKYQNGDVYEGDFENGKANDKGV